jgi:hypothetical protein
VKPLPASDIQPVSYVLYCTALYCTVLYCTAHSQSLYCRSSATAIWHTANICGNTHRTGEVLAIIFKLFSATYSRRLTKTYVTLTSASQTGSCYDKQPSAVVCGVCQLVQQLSRCTARALSCSSPLHTVRLTNGDQLVTEICVWHFSPQTERLTARCPVTVTHGSTEVPRAVSVYPERKGATQRCLTDCTPLKPNCGDNTVHM